MNTTEILAIAANHSVANNSAALCFCEAQAAANRGDAKAVRMWALKAVAHSGGVFHADHAAIKAVVVA